MAIISANQVTRMGMAGAMWQPHGSYANKVPSIITPPSSTTAGGGGDGAARKIDWEAFALRENLLREDARINAVIQDDQDILELLCMVTMSGVLDELD